MKPKEIAEKLGVPVQRIYVLRSNLKKKKLAKKIVSNVTTKKSYAGTNYILKLENEVSQYHKWCLEWREKYEKLEQDYANAKVMFLNSQAVVDYLENKVANLITISNLKGN
jgi:sugar-specific transcriptional regulator TrmB